MKLMDGFLFLCVCLGLWGPRGKLMPWLIAGMAVLLVLAFWISPHQM